jgi:hypothetical protein
MEDLIYKVKPIVPQPIWKAMTSPYWWWHNRARHQLAAIFDSRLSRSQGDVRKFHNLHKGERCFIIGNGPSLNQTNLDLLRDEITFGMNRIYLNFPNMGFQTDYFISVNTLVLEQCAEEIRALDVPRFITWRARHMFDDEVIFLDTDYTEPAEFCGDLTGRIFEGSTVTFVAMQIAYYMGFEEVILIGVDHNFQSLGRPNETVISQGDDPNHFSPSYFGKGFKWQLPDLAASEQAYHLAREAYEADGRKIFDATIGGKLEVFPKTQYETLFS